MLWLSKTDILCVQNFFQLSVPFIKKIKVMRRTNWFQWRCIRHIRALPLTVDSWVAMTEKEWKGRNLTKKAWERNELSGGFWCWPLQHSNKQAYTSFLRDNQNFFHITSFLVQIVQVGTQSINQMLSDVVVFIFLNQTLPHHPHDLILKAILKEWFSCNIWFILVPSCCSCES